MRLSLRTLNPLAKPRRNKTIFIYLGLIFTLVVIGISCVVALLLVAKPLKYTGNTSLVGLYVDVELLSIDASLETLTIDIYPYFRAPSEWFEQSCGTDGRYFNFYTNQNFGATGSASRNYSSIQSNYNTSAPTYQFYLPCKWNDKYSSTFRKSLKLVAPPPDDRSKATTEGQKHEHKFGDVESSGLQSYPFDKYIADLWLFVEEPENQVHTQNVTLGALRGVANNYDADYDLIPEGPTTLHITFKVKRSNAIKLFCLIIVIANWILTLIFIWITVACVIWKEKVAKEMFIIPASELFAFTAEREYMPGAPSGFGTFIDYIAVLPNLAIMTICSFVLIFLITLERVQGMDRPPKGTRNPKRKAPNPRRDTSNPKQDPPNPKRDVSEANLDPDKEQEPAPIIGTVLSAMDGRHTRNDSDPDLVGGKGQYLEPIIGTVLSAISHRS